jgi:hypothetical protein
MLFAPIDWTLYWIVLFSSDAGTMSPSWYVFPFSLATRLVGPTIVLVRTSPAFAGATSSTSGTATDCTSAISFGFSAVTPRNGSFCNFSFSAGVIRESFSIASAICFHVYRGSFEAWISVGLVVSVGIAVVVTLFVADGEVLEPPIRFTKPNRHCQQQC